jgi:hypothetical protein
MGILDKVFGRDNDEYLDMDEITKSFRSGKSDQRIDTDYYDIPMANNGKSSDKSDDKQSSLSQDYFIRHKKDLRMYANDLLVQAIIRTRTNQVLRYAMPADWTEDGVGFKIVPKDPSKFDKDNPKYQAKIKQIEKFIYYTGKDHLDWRDDFPTFLTKILYDFYVYDQVNFERVYESARSNQLNHFNAVDAGTILIDKYPKSIDKKKTYVQYIEDKPAHEFTEREMVFQTYWARSNMESKGYGFSPVEAAIPQIGYHINTEQFNARIFSQGGLTRGVLLVDNGENGMTSKASLDSIRRGLTSAQGNNGAWKIPIIAAKDAKYVNMTQSSKDMEFVNFLNYLTNIITANFNIQPDEINFPNKGGATSKGGGTTLNEGNTTKTKMHESKATGLTPVLRFIERLMNDRVLNLYDDDFRFVFTSGDPLSPTDKAKKIQEEEIAGKTLNEGRKEMGLDPIEGGDTPGTAKEFIQMQNVLNKDDSEAQQSMQHSNDYKKDDNNKGVSN